MTSQAELDRAIAGLLSQSGDASNGDVLLGHIETVTRHLRRSRARPLIAKLDRLSDQTKVLIVQQFFRHAEAGSHKTDFDHDIVSVLLLEWFNIRLDDAALSSDADNRHRPHLPGRPAHGGVCHLRFGDTDIFLNSTTTRESAASSLIETIEDNAVLTTDKTSPPCKVSEFVPLWLGNRDLPVMDYYIDRGGQHPIADYFRAQIDAVLTELGVDIREPSTEMAIIANADALRFHRDRLVNQYEHLQRSGEPPEAYRLVQDLTLVDWDMQGATMSGTVFDHPNGDRYLFALYPGEIVGMFFSEAVQLPGPMMMPYHCALPVIDRLADVTAGQSKGKRLSTLVRGVAYAEELAKLAERATSLSVNDVASNDRNTRSYVDGIEIAASDVIPRATMAPVAILENDQGLSVAELDVKQNESLLRAVTSVRGRKIRLFHIEKQGDGFSVLHQVIPGFGDADQIFIVNRTRHSPHRGANYPVALDFTHRGQPWIQLLPMDGGSVMSCPQPERDLVRMSPPNEVLHRSSLLDSFYPSASTRNRMVTAADIAVVY